jgi:hypothetical protein
MMPKAAVDYLKKVFRFVLCCFAVLYAIHFMPQLNLYTQ